MNKSFTETEIRSVLDRFNLLPVPDGRYALWEDAQVQGGLAEIIFHAMANNGGIEALESLRSTISTLKQAIRLIEEIQNEH